MFLWLRELKASRLIWLWVNRTFGGQSVRRFTSGVTSAGCLSTNFVLRRLMLTFRLNFSPVSTTTDTRLMDQARLHYNDCNSAISNSEIRAIFANPASHHTHILVNLYTHFIRNWCKRIWVPVSWTENLPLWRNLGTELKCQKPISPRCLKFAAVCRKKLQLIAFLDFFDPRLRRSCL